MSKDCRRRRTCRLCGGRDLALVLKLTPTPPANAFVAEDAKSKDQPCFPLDVFFCGGCAHVQLLDVVDPRLLFEDYVYVSGTSPLFVDHFAEYAEVVIKRFKPKPGDLVVDVGSNDGTLLRKFKDRGLRALGVDPARAIAKRATEAGIDTIADFLTPRLAVEIRDKHGPAALVTANNVFAHADDLAGLRDAASGLLAPDGVFVFEVSYLKDVVEKTLFDTIYHEHLAYHSVKPLRRFFEAGGMEMFAVERIDVHGGSLRGMALAVGGPHPADGSVAKLVALEEKSGLDHAATFQDFADRIGGLGRDLKRLVAKIRANGKSIAGFGAPAKATTLMYHFGIGPDVVDFIVDDNPLKQGLYTAGHHIPVLPSQALYERRPDYVIVLAWNFAGSIMAKHSVFKDMGGRFIVPLPRLEVY
ncbi:MAG: class I SAM-dependent methyltransferase [Rhodospirillales bacterium]|nr:class I SAM-dependent methyltransferase [Rhodospirillales bacterium]